MYIRVVFEDFNGLFSPFFIDKQVVRLIKTLPSESLDFITKLCELNGAHLVDYVVRGHERRMILDIFIDNEAGVSLDICESINRSLNEASEHDKFLGSVYTLEVSSPGVDRPLRFSWQYPKHIGRLVTVTKSDDTRISGRLLSADESSLSIAPVAKHKNNKKTMTEEAITLSFTNGDVASAVIEIEW